jgi:hypothetical protein
MLDGNYRYVTGMYILIILFSKFTFVAGTE